MAGAFVAVYVLDMSSWTHGMHAGLVRGCARRLFGGDRAGSLVCESCCAPTILTATAAGLLMNLASCRLRGLDRVDAAWISVHGPPRTDLC